MWHSFMIHKNITEKKLFSWFSILKIGAFKENGDSSGKDNTFGRTTSYKNMVSYLYNLGLHWLQVAENSITVLSK